MPINFRVLNQNLAAALIDPRDIFNALPAKPADMNFLRGPQDQVLEKWFQRRTTRDLVIKLNTGGGKTVVGLLIAQSSLAEQVGPVTYLVPDRYLADQVEREAARLGLTTTRDAKSFAYTQGRAILVDTFQKLFNGKSVFGVAGSAGRSSSAARPRTLIIDDAHACLNKAEQAFRLVVPRSHDVHDKLLNLYEDVLKRQAPASYLALVDGRSSSVQQIPFWAWADRESDTLAALHTLSEEDAFMFSWPLLVDVLSLCRAVFTAEGLEIEAPCLPADVVLGFEQADRRVYLTATLADDGVLVTDLGANSQAVTKPITPASAGDIGDRLILVPQQTHPTATPDEIRDLIVDLALSRNVVVIVPSERRAAYWKPYAAMTLDKNNLTVGVETMRANPKIGLVVLLNRYDGVDLPGDACHVLVVDGLPEALTGTERVDQAQLAGSELLVARQVQRLEQGMGRATRSNDDHCVVFLLGARLAERLYGPVARGCFSPATVAQLELSEHVASQLEGTGLESLSEAALQCLGRDADWVAASRAALAPLRYGPASVGEIAIATRRAFDRAITGDFNAAIDALQKVINTTSDAAVQGYLLQQLAAYQHHLDPVQAQQTQLSANHRNRNLLRPMAGVIYEKLSAPTLEQGAAAATYLQQRYASGNALVIGMNALLGDLVWGPKTEAFEQAWADIADHLGVAGQRPERDTGRGPDGLWALTDATFLVCEAKSKSKDNHPIYKKDAEQLSNSMDWFRSEYGSNTKATPLLIHPRREFDKRAAIPTGCRVVSTAKLAALRAALQKLIAGLADNDTFRDGTRAGKLLDSLGLTTDQFIAGYTDKATPGSAR